MINTNDIIFALKCSASTGVTCKRESCPYYYIPSDADVERFMTDPLCEGMTAEQVKDFMCGCDIDRIALDAADRLEEFNGRI